MRAKVAVTTSNAGRCPISAQCRIPGAPRSTHYAVRGRGEAEPGPGPLTGDVVAAHRDGRGRCGAGKIGRALAKKGKAASRRRITGTMEGNSPTGACARARFEPHADGHAAGARKDAELARSAFATVAFPLFDVDVFHSGRGSEFDDVALDEMFEVFGITRSLSKRGCPHGNAVVESANKMLKAELVYGESFGSLEELRVKLSGYVWWYNHERMHSTLGYMSPVEFREKSLTLMSK